MKKTYIIITLLLGILFTLPAAKYDRADGFGIGVSTGYPVSGATFKYGMGDFRIVGNIGYNYYDAFALEVGLQYDLDSFHIDRLPFYLNFGITAAANFAPRFDDFLINVPIGISYFLADVPVELFFKIIPGLYIEPTHIDSELGAALGVLYYVNK